MIMMMMKMLVQSRLLQFSSILYNFPLINPISFLFEKKLKILAFGVHFMATALAQPKVALLPQARNTLCNTAVAVAFAVVKMHCTTHHYSTQLQYSVMVVFK